MSPHPNTPRFHFRVRYAECTAHGELALASYINYFSEAAAQALSERGMDLRTLTSRSGALCEAGYEVAIQASPGYDDELEVEVRLHALDERGFTLGFGLQAARGGRPLARGAIRYDARSSGPDGACRVPLDLHGLLQAWPV